MRISARAHFTFISETKFKRETLIRLLLVNQSFDSLHSYKQAEKTKRMQKKQNSKLFAKYKVLWNLFRRRFIREARAPAVEKIITCCCVGCTDPRNDSLLWKRVVCNSELTSEQDDIGGTANKRHLMSIHTPTHMHTHAHTHACTMT